MSWWDAVLLFVAGIGGGLVGSIAGLASLTTYPALLLVGLPPVAANVTNTVALVFNGVGSVSASLPELRGQRSVLLRLVPAGILGGAAGAALLLAIPAEGFEDVVPILLAASAVAIALPQRDRLVPVRRTVARTVLQGVAVLAICVYGGFFGAAAGVLMLALFLRTGSDSLAHANATKNVVLGVANGVAALIFIAFAPIHWLAVLPLGAGCLLGSRIGPSIVRRAPPAPLRLLIAAAGLALAVKLGFDTYR
ncbi:sulfite exporter TauE/SafE family protein [Mycolicibacterium sp. 050158]|uniref:sulfite exporter TauE/SafE family protein n=1 Tax=Mycolicibacterium sp. 050158 TaxID=3090602 RepID=UPI00299E246F|nr:sulfite exporter TauE/SafE family protein [Mycolicibacterium sp. 050158]MDX1889014.1 sulfite exporter TauE/SafE family protein [Mycolicibacterium sp. 050158]